MGNYCDKLFFKPDHEHYHSLVTSDSLNLAQKAQVYNRKVRFDIPQGLDDSSNYSSDDEEYEVSDSENYGSLVEVVVDSLKHDDEEFQAPRLDFSRMEFLDIPDSHEEWLSIYREIDHEEVVEELSTFKDYSLHRGQVSDDMRVQKVIAEEALKYMEQKLMTKKNA